MSRIGSAIGPWSSASEIAVAVAKGDSALAIVDATLDRVKKIDRKLNCFTAVVADRARAHARAIDKAHNAGKPLGPLAGVPFAVKNLFDVARLPTLAGSKINRSRKPAKRDATLVERLEAAGAVLVGALNMGEYAYDFTGENVHDGSSRNPHDLRYDRWASGGSGGAVAGGLVPPALGSDTMADPRAVVSSGTLDQTHIRAAFARTCFRSSKPGSCWAVRALAGFGAQL
jgi:aspartyl-tRNA(Asn)/glutamyl-tRNA(Gln) amidotransferase subunit A